MYYSFFIALCLSSFIIPTIQPFLIGKIPPNIGSPISRIQHLPSEIPEDPSCVFTPPFMGSTGKPSIVSVVLSHSSSPDFVTHHHGFIDKITHEFGYTMVKMISSILPHVDSIGHNILHMDDEFINYIINLQQLSPELKKDIILSIIHISQQGDNFGGHVLQMYYDIVNQLM